MSLIEVDATPEVLVEALAVWLPRTKTMVRPPSAVPVASFSTALRVIVLFGPPLRGPVYVTLVALRAMAIEPHPVPDSYRLSAVKETPVTYLPAAMSGV